MREECLCRLGEGFCSVNAERKRLCCTDTATHRHIAPPTLSKPSHTHTHTYARAHTRRPHTRKRAERALTRVAVTRRGEGGTTVHDDTDRVDGGLTRDDVDVKCLAQRVRPSCHARGGGASIRRPLLSGRARIAAMGRCNAAVRAGVPLSSSLTLRLREVCGRARLAYPIPLACDACVCAFVCGCTTPGGARVSRGCATSAPLHLRVRFRGVTWRRLRSRLRRETTRQDMR